ncbi:MAG: hypothetical protein JO144_14130, partial [Actinobacteria bacterium]|nr:hypothetical protein [Actinomycetota bacterium]
IARSTRPGRETVRDGLGSDLAGWLACWELGRAPAGAVVEAVPAGARPVAFAAGLVLAPWSGPLREVVTALLVAAARAAGVLLAAAARAAGVLLAAGTVRAAGVPLAAAAARAA